MKKLFFLILFFSSYSFADIAPLSCSATHWNKGCDYPQNHLASCNALGGYVELTPSVNCMNPYRPYAKCFRADSCTCPSGFQFRVDTVDGVSKGSCFCPSGFSQVGDVCLPDSSSSSSSSISSSSASSSSSCPQNTTYQGMINDQPFCQPICPEGMYAGSVNGEQGCYGTNNCPNGQAYGAVNGVYGCYGSASNSSAASASSAANSSSNNSTGSNTSSGSGDNGNNGSGSSSGSNTSSGSNHSSGSNSSSGAGECDPTSNDYLDCLMPNVDSEPPIGDFSESQEAADAELEATKAELNAKFNEVKNQFSNAFGATLQPAARQLEDFCITVRNQEVCFGLGKFQSQLNIIGLIVMFVAAFIALRIVLSR